MPELVTNGCRRAGLDAHCMHGVPTYKSWFVFCPAMPRLVSLRCARHERLCWEVLSLIIGIPSFFYGLSIMGYSYRQTVSVSGVESPGFAAAG